MSEAVSFPGILARPKLVYRCTVPESAAQSLSRCLRRLRPRQLFHSLERRRLGRHPHSTALWHRFVRRLRRRRTRHTTAFKYIASQLRRRKSSCFTAFETAI